MKAFKRNTRKRGRRSQRGGDTKLHACKMPFPQGLPEAKCIGEEIEEEVHKKLTDTISAIPNDTSFLILKIGSNDDPAVATNAYSNTSKYGNSAGTRGINQGKHYIEVSSTGVLKGQLNDNSKFVDLNEIPKNMATGYMRQIKAILVEKNGDNTKGFLLNITPTPKHNDFNYPFGEKDADGFQVMIYNTIKNFLKAGSEHVQTFFPLTPTGRNQEVLDFFVNYPNTLIIYNAMASSCYTSMKYMIDMRMRAGKQTIYMGLCDTLNNSVECDIFHPIYPNRDESCTEFKNDQAYISKSHLCKSKNNTKKNNTNKNKQASV